MASRLHVLQQIAHRIIISRLINTTSIKMEKALENLQKNPHYEKYASRIAELQKTSPEEFMARVEKQKKAKEEEKRMKFASVDVKQFSSTLNPKKAIKAGYGSEEHKLGDILKVELVEDKEATEIQRIWEEYHQHKDVIAAVIPGDVYGGMEAAMRAHPSFLLPLPRAHGYEFVLCQSRAHAVHCTPLLAFQVHAENAPECLTMLHYTELRRAKGLVLMRGAYDKNVLNGREAQCLANQFQMYYNTKDSERLRLLDTFTNKSEDFNHMDLIAQMENITLQ